MKFLTITFDRPVQNPLKSQGIYQATHSAPVDIQVEDNGRVTLTAPDGVRVVVQGIGFHGVPAPVVVAEPLPTKDQQLVEALDLGLKSPRTEPGAAERVKRGKGKPGA
jgi:hypothetical protein